MPDIGKRVREVPAIHDLDVRRKVINSFPDYRQIICVALPPIGTYTPPDKAEDVAKLANDGLKELCDKYPDQFAGFVAEVPLTAPDAGARESERAIKELGACGVQIVTNVNGKPLDRPEFEPFFARMNALKMPVWVHPTRTAAMPDYADEKKSLYEIWWTFGWSYETAAFMGRMVFSKTLDKYPDLKILVHHFGGIVPMLEGRIGPGWDQIGARTSDEDYVVAAQIPEEAADRLFQAGLLHRHRGVRRRRRDHRGQDVLSARQDRVRLRLPVRSREGPDVHPRDACG